TMEVFGILFSLFDTPHLAAAGTVLVVGVFSNWLALRIFEHLHVADAGLHWGKASAENMAIGLGGGIVAAVLVLGPPLLIGAAHLVPARGYELTVGSLIFNTAVLAGGAVGEELMVHGYGFQLLIAAIGPWATVVPVGALFAFLHYTNPAS